MALISRVSRLFTADLHAVLDRIEEPQALLKQAVREMEEEVANGERQLKWFRHEIVQLDKKHVASNGVLEALDAELDICFEAGEEMLAKSLVRRKLSEQQRNKVAVAQLDAVTGTAADLAATLEDQHFKLDEMRQYAELVAEEPTADVRVCEASINQEVSQEEVDVAFLREKQSRSRT
jgi:phage shock protein A